MKFINLTPHEIVLDDDERRVVIPSSGVVRCSETYIEMPTLDGWPVSRVCNGAPVGLPDPQEDVYYIVSNLVMQTLRDKRKDIIAPNTGVSARRDTMGNIVSVRGFVQ